MFLKRDERKARALLPAGDGYGTGQTDRQTAENQRQCHVISPTERLKDGESLRLYGAVVCKVIARLVSPARSFLLLLSFVTKCVKKLTILREILVKQQKNLGSYIVIVQASVSRSVRLEKL